MFSKSKALFLCLATFGLILMSLANARDKTSGVNTKFPDFSKPEPGEAFPGGKATSRKSVKNRNA